MDKVKELFHYFNIKGEVDSVYDNWAVSNYGDVVNYVFPFAIFSIHINDGEWIDNLRKKEWFKPECEDAFLKALARAKEIMDINVDD